MSKDKVMHPTNKSRAGGIKQVKTGIVEGPVAKGSDNNLNPFNRGKKK